MVFTIKIDRYWISYLFHFFRNSADGVIAGSAKYEHLIVAAQEIGASVAQLFVSSRVKADRDSQKLKELGGASKAVFVAHYLQSIF